MSDSTGKQQQKNQVGKAYNMKIYKLSHCIPANKAERTHLVTPLG